jgi:hypothetical protein
MRLSDQDSVKDVSQDATQDSTKDVSQDATQDSTKDAARDSSKDVLQDSTIGRKAKSKITNVRTGHFKNFFMC